mgnify:CR=1 FL=1
MPQVSGLNDAATVHANILSGAQRILDLLLDRALQRARAELLVEALAGAGCDVEPLPGDDDVAERLMELGVSVHLPGPAEQSDFRERFGAAIDQYLTNPSGFLPEREERLRRLNCEIQQTLASFNFPEVLQSAIERRRECGCR